MIEMEINGISTRMVEQITEKLCGRDLSKCMISTLCRRLLDIIAEAFRNRPLDNKYPFLVIDAIYFKIKVYGRVQSKGLLIAAGINEESYGEILGFKLAENELESSWGELFSEVKDRNLKLVDLVTSDDHSISSRGSPGRDTNLK